MKYVFVGVAVFLVAILGIYYFSSSKPKITDNQRAVDSALMPAPGFEDNVPEMIVTEDDRYVIYKDQTSLNPSGKRRVLYFYANWCPTCIPVDKEFRENLSRIPEDVSIIRVNYNDSDTDKNEEDLAKKYGITYQHTFVQIDDQGGVVYKWNGGGINELISNLK